MKKTTTGLQRPCSDKVKHVIGRPFPKGTSGNPAGKRKGSVSIAATIRRLLSKEDAERIAQRLVALAKGGDLQAVKLLMDRIDGGAQSGLLFEPLAGAVQIILVDNHRNDRDPREILSNIQLPDGITDEPPPPPDDGDPATMTILDAGNVVSAEVFLRQ